MEKKPFNRMEPQPLNGMEPDGPHRDIEELKRAMMEGNRKIQEYIETAPELCPEPDRLAVELAGEILQKHFSFTETDTKRFIQLLTREIRDKK